MADELNNMAEAPPSTSRGKSTHSHLSIATTRKSSHFHWRSRVSDTHDYHWKEQEWTEWRDYPEGDSTFAAFINLVKGAIGSGIVYFPAAAGSCGLLLALILVVIMAVVSAHTTSLVAVILLMARNIGRKLVGNEPIDTFEDIAKVCWGKWGFVVVTFINYLDLVLTVAVFMGTLANTIDDVIIVCTKENVRADGSVDFSYEAPYWRFIGLVGACILVVFPLCCLKTLDAISKMSIFGVLANVVILICIIVSSCQDNPKFDENVNLMGSYANNATINTHQGYIDMFRYCHRPNYFAFLKFKTF